MQVLCMVTEDSQGDVQCPCCKQSYKVYYSRLHKGECEEALREVLETLAAHHVGNPLPSAHRSDCFNVPEWRGPAHASAAALLSGAPVRRPSRAPIPFVVQPVAEQRRVS